uniref:Phase change-related protein n=1 Tax=Vitis cinerea var. helleri x Vitis riparia TaxID=152274 RepID=D3W0X6_9ROSI|nr:phase change-related protein [Vitis cinerea var. helleri x Vitis riparia]
MAYSKTFLLVGLLFAVVLILSSEVSARDLAETSQTQVSVEDAKYGGYGRGYGHGKGHGYQKGHGHGKPGHGGPGHPPGHGGAGEAVEEGTQN